MQSAKKQANRTINYGTAVVRRLRRNFIFITMVSLAVVLVAVCTAIYQYYSYANQKHSDSIIEVLNQNNGHFPPPDSERNPSSSMAFTVNYETEYENRYAWAIVDAQTDQIIQLSSSHIAQIERRELYEMTEEILASGQSHGYLQSNRIYRYGVFDKPNNVKMVILLDCYLRQQTRTAIVQGSAAASLLCLALVCVILIPLSKRVATPFARNLDRQQQFVTNASHELKTPLAIISANNDVVERLSGETQWTRSTKTQVKRLDQLIRDLIEMARSSEVYDLATLDPIDFSEVVERSVEDFRPLADKKGKTLRVSIFRNLKVRGSSEALDRLICILLDNAVKYADANSCITVTLSATRRQVKLRVGNLASSLDEREVGKLFNRFYRSNSLRSSNGYGIGLSVAQSIVERHNGTLSAIGEGNVLTFIITLPRTTDKENGNSAATAAAS